MGHEGHDHPHGHHGPSASSVEHHQAAPAQVAAAVVVCSDTRDAGTDRTGPAIRDRLLRAGHSIVGLSRVPNVEADIRKAIDLGIDAGARALIISGGTGIGRADRTIEVVEGLAEKRLDGFGELFRNLSFAAIGPAAMLSRSVAATYRGAVIFALPGSPHAVELALDHLILPELGHLVRELSR